MSLPTLDKKLWADRAQRRAYLDEVVRLADAAADDASRVALFAQLGYLVELHNDGKVSELDVAPKTIKRWREVVPVLHRAYYGFTPGEHVAADVLYRAFDGWPREQFDALLGLANEVADANDGGSPAQIAKALRGEAKRRALKLDPPASVRLAAAAAFAPIPPR